MADLEPKVELACPVGVPFLSFSVVSFCSTTWMFNEICAIIHFCDLILIFQNVYKIIIKKLGKNFFVIYEVTSSLSNKSFAWTEFLE